MNNSIDEAIQKAVPAMMAEAIVKMLDGPTRENLIAKAVSGLMDSYDMRRLIEKAVIARAEEIAAKIIESGTYDQQLTAAINTGLSNVMQQVPDAVQHSFRHMLAGDPQADYGRGAGLLARYIYFPSSKNK